MPEEAEISLKGTTRMKMVSDRPDVDTEPFVSVLTPVYNGAKFLRQCIESVLEQDYDNWEYVLVNNYSTDNSLEIMQEYAARDERIRIHNNEEFLPQMQNLNHAFRQISSKSKYCKVVHADDKLFKDCIKEMVRVAEAYPTIGIVSSYRLVNNKVDADGLPHTQNFFPGKEIARQYLLNGTSRFGSPSTLLLRSDLIRSRDKVYDESYLRSDSGACLDLLKDSDFGFVHRVLTFSRRHDESVTNTLAKESDAYIRGALKFQLEYGSYYLSEKERRKRLQNRINLYYILLVRNLFEEKSINKFKKQIQILESLGLKIEVAKFLRKFIRELFLQLFKSFGIEAKKSAER